MPKQSQYFIPKENYKKVEEVRELENKELITPEEQAELLNIFKERQNLINNKSKLSPAARNKIIKRHGGDYLSERAFNRDIALMEMYGPGIWSDVGGFIAKTAATTLAAGVVISTAGTAAPLVGAGIWLGGKAVEEVGKETDNSFLRSVGSFAKDTGFGSMTTLALKDVKFVSDCASMGIDIKKLNKIKDLAEPMLAIQQHKEHRDRGRNYDRNCDVCNL